MSYISGQVSSESLAFLVSAEVWEVLFKFDELLAEETRLKGSPAAAARTCTSPATAAPTGAFRGL
ncbi:MAG: hypothetical protein OXC26_18265 [Albidovulum sp.]|nr:hypothetical protein [Albidovulum sp.]